MTTKTSCRISVFRQTGISKYSYNQFIMPIYNKWVLNNIIGNNLDPNGISANIDVSALESGAYLLKVIFSDGLCEVQKIIKTDFFAQ